MKTNEWKRTKKKEKKNINKSCLLTIFFRIGYLKIQNRICMEIFKSKFTHIAIAKFRKNLHDKQKQITLKLLKMNRTFSFRQKDEKNEIIHNCIFGLKINFYRNYN